MTNCPIKRNFFACRLFIAAANYENIFNSKRKTLSVKKIVRYEFCLSTSETQVASWNRRNGDLLADRERIILELIFILDSTDEFEEC